MIYHASIAARDPERAAKAIAEVWGGEAVPFFPTQNGSWIALAGDDRGSAIEVYYPGIVKDPGAPNSEVLDPVEIGTHLTSTHFAIETKLSEEEVIAIGEREGWCARVRGRNLPFAVVELWVDNHILFEVLTPTMLADYLKATTMEGWHSYLDKVRGTDIETRWNAIRETQVERMKRAEPERKGVSDIRGL